MNILLITLAAFVALAGLATMALGIVEAVRGTRLRGVLIIIGGAVAAAIATASLLSTGANSMFFEHHEDSGIVEDHDGAGAAHMSDEPTSAPDEKD